MTALIQLYITTQAAVIFFLQNGSELFVMDIIDEVSSDILVKTLKHISPEDKVGNVHVSIVHMLNSHAISCGKTRSDCKHSIL